MKGRRRGKARGWLLTGSGSFRSDRASDPDWTDAELRALAERRGQELTYTCAPPGSGVRMALDRDEDGHLDRDELDAHRDPANPGSFPGGPAVPGCGQGYGMALLLPAGVVARKRLRGRPAALG